MKQRDIPQSLFKRLHKEIVIISDAGVDDLLALALLSKITPKHNHTVISTYGNVKEEYTSANIQEFIDFSKSPWSFMRGVTCPLRPMEIPWADYFHGEDGAWGVHPKPHFSIPLLITEYPQVSSVISLGPLTQTRKIRKEKNVDDIVIMGGAFNHPGNETKYAEYNIRCDPDASAEFFTNPRVKETIVVPLNVTSLVQWSEDMVSHLLVKTEKQTWMKKLITAWFSGWGIKKKSKFIPFDVLAVYLSFYPQEAVWEKSGISVITEGEKRGMTVFTSDNPHCFTAVDLVDSQKTSENILDLMFE